MRSISGRLASGTAASGLVVRWTNAAAVVSRRSAEPPWPGSRTTSRSESSRSCWSSSTEVALPSTTSMRCSTPIAARSTARRTRSRRAACSALHSSGGSSDCWGLHGETATTSAPARLATNAAHCSAASPLSEPSAATTTRRRTPASITAAPPASRSVSCLTTNTGHVAVPSTCRATPPAGLRGGREWWPPITRSRAGRSPRCCSRPRPGPMSCGIETRSTGPRPGSSMRSRIEVRYPSGSPWGPKAREKCVISRTSGGMSSYTVTIRSGAPSRSAQAAAVVRTTSTSSRPSSATTTAVPSGSTTAFGPVTTTGRRMRSITSDPTAWRSLATGSGSYPDAKQSTFRSSLPMASSTAAGLGSTTTSTSASCSPARLASSWTCRYVQSSSASLGATPTTRARAFAVLASEIPIGSAPAADSDPSSGITTFSNISRLLVARAAPSSPR